MKCPNCQHDIPEVFSLSPKQMTYLVGLAHGQEARALAERLGVASPEPSTAEFRSMQLTPRERQVSALIAQGCGTIEIADRLGMATQNVRNTLHRAYGKTGTRTRSALGAWATKEGLL